jgi:hypothetical protein
MSSRAKTKRLKAQRSLDRRATRSVAELLIDKAGRAPGEETDRLAGGIVRQTNALIAGGAPPEIVKAVFARNGILAALPRAQHDAFDERVEEYIGKGLEMIDAINKAAHEFLPVAT